VDSPSIGLRQLAAVVRALYRTIYYLSVFRSYTLESVAFNPGQSGTCSVDSPGSLHRTVWDPAECAVFTRSFELLFPSGLDSLAVLLGHHRRYLATCWVVGISLLRAFDFGVCFWDSGQIFRKKFEAPIQPLVAVSGPSVCDI
jgi:hypothetical protein